MRDEMTRRPWAEPRLAAVPSRPWHDVPPAGRALAGPPRRPVVPVDPGTLVDHAEGTVVVDHPEHHLDEAVRAEVLADLARRGIPVVLTAPLPPSVRDRVGRDVAEALQALAVADLPDTDRVGLAAAEAHRAALLAGGVPTTSVLAATRRPGRLDELAMTLARQAGASPSPVQVVVALHGEGFGPDAATRVRRQVPDALVVACDRRMPFGAVLQAAADRADGEVLAKVDDDDLYADDHVAEVAAAVVAQGVEVAGRAAELVHLARPDVTIRRRFGVTTGLADSVAGGTMAVRADALRGVGGWPAVRAAVDRELLDRLRAAGGRVHRQPPFGYLLVRHGDAHTWQADDRRFLEDAVRHWRGLRTDIAGVAQPPSP